ncbi:hypothetical protein TNIN_345581, partial [Trichonephila inaurata madagascariensis]
GQVILVPILERGGTIRTKVCERDRYGRGVMVWASYMTKQRFTSLTEKALHRNEIILDNVRIYRGAVGPNFLFMGDKARLHRSIEVSDTLQRENILRMQWTTYSCLNTLKGKKVLLGGVLHEPPFPPYRARLKTT